MQIRPPAGSHVDLERLGARWQALAATPAQTSFTVQTTDSMLRLDMNGYRLSVFPDGRALVFGTEDLERAAQLYDEFVGVT